MVAPPPWTLSGNGLVLLAHFPESFVRAHGFLADYQQTGYRGWIGTVILADYTTSDVGPYRELMFIPGLIHHHGKTAFSISKIYVSTLESVENGRRNWAIPKEQADFTIETLPDGVQQWVVSQDGTPFFSIQVKADGFAFPISTRLMPAFKLVQKLDNQALLTQPIASGRARLARLKNLQVRSELFPDISQGTYLIALAIQPFQLIFPPPVPAS